MDPPPYQRVQRPRPTQSGKAGPPDPPQTRTDARALPKQVGRGRRTRRELKLTPAPYLKRTIPSSILCGCPLTTTLAFVNDSGQGMITLAALSSSRHVMSITPSRFAIR